VTPRKLVVHVSVLALVQLLVSVTTPKAGKNISVK